MPSRHVALARILLEGCTYMAPSNCRDLGILGAERALPLAEHIAWVLVCLQLALHIAPLPACARHRMQPVVLGTTGAADVTY